MKKTILSIAAMLMTSSLSMAQFTFTPDAITPTGLTFTGNTLPTVGTHGQFYQNQAYAPGTNYNSNTCTVATTGLGGFDAHPDFTPYIHSTADGITYFGGGIANVYFDEAWGTCVDHIPSVGFNSGTGNSGLNDGYDIDLSNPANQKIQFTYTSDIAWTLELQLFDGAYNAKLTSTPIAIAIGTHTITIDFSTKLVGAASSVSTVRQVSLLYNSTTPSNDFQFAITDIKLGSAIVTGLTNSTSVANANLYPNPSTGMTTISGELKSVADVKITLVDMLGQEVKVITEERTNSINSAFDVSALKKGIYSVVTNIDGAPSKSQMLVVR